MSRINWMNIAIGAVLFVSLLFAFLYGWYQWGNKTRANENQTEVKRQIAIVEQELRVKEQGYKPLIGTLTAPDDCTSAVTSTPAKSPRRRVRVHEPSISRSALPEASLRPSLMSDMPSSSSPRPPMKLPISCVIFLVDSGSSIHPL